jgi:hypothetical protein
MDVRSINCVCLSLLLISLLPVTPNRALADELDDILKMDIYQLMQLDIEQIFCEIFLLIWLDTIFITKT